MFTRRILELPRFGESNPFVEMERLRRQMDLLSEWISRGSPSGQMFSAGVFPLINLTETQDCYFVRAELPGLKAGEIDIQIVGRNLTIAGERKIPSEGENVKYHRRERESGKFSRVINLPDEIDNEKIEAKMNNGLLAIKLPKTETAKPRQIAVK